MHTIQIEYYGDFDILQTKVMVGDKDPEEMRRTFEARFPTLLQPDEEIDFDPAGGGFPDTYRGKSMLVDQMKHQFVQHLVDHGYKDFRPTATIRFSD